MDRSPGKKKGQAVLKSATGSRIDSKNSSVFPRLPSQVHLGDPDVRPPPLRVVLHRFVVDHAALAAHLALDDAGKVKDGVLDRVADVHRAERNQRLRESDFQRL